MTVAVTAAERDQWARLTSESEAEQFVADYDASRGGEKLRIVAR